MVSEETVTQEQSQSQGIDPGAFDRIKRERDQAKQEVETAKAALANTLLVDTLYGHFKSKEGIGGDRYELAKEAAKAPGIAEAENPAEAADQWLARISGLLGSAPSAQSPPPPMAAARPNPGAAGISVEQGPFKVGSKEWTEFVQQNGMRAAYKAVEDGQFFFSSDNREAQATAALY